MKKTTLNHLAGLVLATLLCTGGTGCFSEGRPGSAMQCSPRDFTTDCCLKQNPGHYEQCLGLTDVYRYAVPTAATLALVSSLPHDGLGSPAPDEALEPQLRPRLREELVRCARLADIQVNERFLGGKSPDARKCSELAPNGEEWSTWLGGLKHAAAKQCLEQRLPSLLPMGRVRLETRFYYFEKRARWLPLSRQEFTQFLNQFGWQVLNKIIAPDVVIYDPTGTRVVAIYDFKFPCPETNESQWDSYSRNHYWSGTTQQRAWLDSLGVRPLRVTPRGGVSRD